MDGFGNILAGWIGKRILIGIIIFIVIGFLIGLIF